MTDVTPSGSINKRRSAWLFWVPVLAGITATPFAIHAAGVMAPSALALLFPFVEIVRSPLVRLPAAAQWVMYVQFPTYGICVGAILRSKNLLIALGIVIFMHVADASVAISLLRPRNS